MIEVKTALVTGGTRGIGRAICKHLLALDDRQVFFCGRQAEVVRAAGEAMRAEHGDRVTGLVADVTDETAVAELVDRVDVTAGRIDLLVNNAGVGHFAPVDEISGEEWRRVLETNLCGAFYATRAVVPIMKRRSSGWIVNIASLAGRNPFAGGAAYNASKFGLVGFSDACMLDLRGHGIRVCAILPGSVATDFSPPKDSGDAWKLTADDVARSVTDLLAYPERALPSRIELRPTRTATG